MQDKQLNAVSACTEVKMEDVSKDCSKFQSHVVSENMDASSTTLPGWDQIMVKHCKFVRILLHGPTDMGKTGLKKFS